MKFKKVTKELTPSSHQNLTNVLRYWFKCFIALLAQCSPAQRFPVYRFMQKDWQCSMKLLLPSTEIPHQRTLRTLPNRLAKHCVSKKLPSLLTRWLWLEKWKPRNHHVYWCFFFYQTWWCLGIWTFPLSYLHQLQRFLVPLELWRSSFPSPGNPESALGVEITTCSILLYSIL